jgi:ParB-like chromosome segregation protein Spo0J
MGSYERHELAMLFPPMDEEESAGLVADIRQNGLREPIILYQGKILDGWNRYLACREIAAERGDDYLEDTYFDEFDGDDDDEALLFVLARNAQRRHLNQSQKAVIALEVEQRLSEAAKRKEQLRKTTLPKMVKSNMPVIHAAERAGQIMGVSRSYITQAKKIKIDYPELIDEIWSGHITLAQASEIARQIDDPSYRSIAAELHSDQKVGFRIVPDEEPDRKLTLADIIEGVKYGPARIALAEAAADKEMPPGFDVWTGDFRDKMAPVDDNSVDLIFTDLPWAIAYTPLYGELACWAARKLKPGASLITYTGHLDLDKRLAAMGEHLRYQWIFAAVHDTVNQRRYGQSIVRVGWTPLVWFVKEPLSHGVGIDDRIESVLQKDLDSWQQSVKVAEYYIKRLTKPGDLVVDPCCRTGTTLVAAHQLKRQANGIELSAFYAEIARNRLKVASL